MIPKFKAWVEREKRMYEVITLGYDFRGTGELVEVDCLNPLGSEYNALEFRATEIELLEWTGLKNIYEGDIVLIRDGECCQGIHEFEEVGIIIFESGAYCFKDKLGNITPLCIIPSGSFEVIGNIYENPELLKGE